MSIEDLVNSISNQEYAKAGPLFSDILNDKIADALDAEKAAVAAAMFGYPDEDDEDDFTDEELEDFDEDEEDEDQ